MSTLTRPALSLFVALVAAVFERLVRADDRTVVMVTHNPELAARCNRRIRIVEGKIVEDTGSRGRERVGNDAETAFDRK